MLAVEPIFLSQLLDFKIGSLEYMFFDTFLFHVAKTYWIPTMCKALCPTRCPSDAHHAALLIAGLWPSLALHWPAASVCGFDFFLSDSQQRAIAHWSLQQEHSLPLGSDFPLEQFIKTTYMWKVWRGETRAGCLAAELTPENGKPFSWRTGYSLFRSDFFFFFWEVKDRDVSRNFDPNYWPK